MVEYDFECRFDDLKYFEIGIFHIPLIHYILEVITTKLYNFLKNYFILFYDILNQI